MRYSTTSPSTSSKGAEREAGGVVGVDVVLGLVGVEGVVAHSGWKAGAHGADGGVRSSADGRR